MHFGNSIYTDDVGGRKCTVNCMSMPTTERRMQRARLEEKHENPKLKGIDVVGEIKVRETRKSHMPSIAHCAHNSGMASSRAELKLFERKLKWKNHIVIDHTVPF